MMEDVFCDLLLMKTMELWENLELHGEKPS